MSQSRLHPTLTAVLGLALMAACTAPTAFDASDDAVPRTRRAASGNLVATAATNAGSKAATVRSWAGHPPSEYEGLVPVQLPDEHPGIPLYARIGYPAGFPEGQIIETDGRVVIVFYREPTCVPDGFNLLDFFHFPGPDGPGAWGCPAFHSGTLYIEPDAPPTAFPKIIDLQGSGVPVWAVDAGQLHAAAADGVLTMPELSDLDRVERSAGFYDEHLHARNEDHFIGAEAKHDPDAPGFRYALIFDGVVTSEAEKVHLVLR